MSRDILAPPLMHMGPNRCYRINLIHEDFGHQYGMTGQQHGQRSSRTYAEEDLYGDDYNDEVDPEIESQIEETNNGMFKLDMHVASSFYGGIIGAKGATKRRIESEAQCDIVIPQRNTSQKNLNSNIIIKAKTRNNVLSARRKILLILSSLRKRMSATHFYGVALNFDIIKQKFVDLKKQILAAEIPNVDESIFQGDDCIHLTFGICLLLDDTERKKACEILQSCREFLNDLHPPFTVRVAGLDIMNDDPSSVRVLYALAKSDELQEFANRCYHRFNQSELAFEKIEGRSSVKLHMTIMNTRYCTTNVKCFDAREILKRWSNFDFGTVQCNELLLCVRGTTNGKSNFYKITDSLKF